MSSNQKSSPKGFSLNQILIALIVISVMIIVVPPAILKFSGSRSSLLPPHKEATENLKDYSASKKLEPISCADSDLDRNGYVDCESKNQKGESIYLECTYEKIDREICRPKVKSDRSSLNN